MPIVRSFRGADRTECQSLERRLLLSYSLLQGPVASAAAAAWYEQRVAVLQSLHTSGQAQPSFQLRRSASSTPLQSAAPDPAGLTPSQLENYYGFTSLRFGSTAANGEGQTIALVEAYDDPDIAADLKTFDTVYGLAASPSFEVVSQTGSATDLPAPDQPNPIMGSWAAEESLDVQWAHALAPAAGILVVECNSQNDADLYTGVAYAAAAPGVSVVSMSFGQSETDYTAAQVAAIDQTFVTPPGHQGVTFLAASGDNGAYADGGPLAVSYPASSPDVVSVGGTTLSTDSSGTIVSETGWSNSGGGLSVLENQPTAQKTAIGSRSGRAVPDVSFDADPSSGVNICDSLDFSAAAPFTILGGTSLSCPAWGSILAIANQGRVIASQPTLDGRQQTIPALYSAYTNGSYDSVFNDITTGNNGFYNAGKGYDLVTGLGSPEVQSLVPQLVSNKVNSTPPTIGSFAITPSVENAGTSIALTASDVTDTIGIVMSVDFYRLNGSHSTMLGAGSVNSSGTWTLPVNTTALPSGTYTYAAVATNNFKQSSARITAVNKVVTGQATPTIGSVVVQPFDVPVGTTVTITAVRVADSTSSIASVAFCLVTAASPVFLGNGVDQGFGKWTLATGTSNLAPGQYRYMAIATAASGLVSQPFRALEKLTLGPPLTLLVNTIKDQTDPPGSKTVSLRDAIAIADEGIGQVTIDFDPKVFATFQTITLTGTTLSLTDTNAPTIINGPSEGVAISGNGAIEDFSIAGGTVVSMSNLTITDGSSTGSGGGLLNAGKTTLSHVIVSDNADSGLLGNGGGIENDGVLSLIDSTITGNSANNGNGGGVYNTDQLTVSDTTISHNTAFNGAGLGNNGAAQITASTIQDNSAQQQGGGIQNAAQLTLVSSTVSGNTADGAAGIYNSAGYQSTSVAVATVTNSTIAENAATGEDGAIENKPSGDLTLSDSTIAANTAPYYGGVDNAGNATLANTIVAGNTAQGQGIDVNGTFNSNGHNLIGQADGSGGWIATDFLGSNAAPLDAHLSPLGYFGGDVPTIVPLAGSAALGNGSTALIPVGIITDERGLPRVVNKKVDIGAVEIQGPSPLKLTAPPRQSVPGGEPIMMNLGSISDTASQGPFNVTVNWGDGSADTSTVDPSTGTIPRESHTFQTLGDLVISVVAADAKGNVSNAVSFAVEVEARPLETIVINTPADQTDPGSATVSLRDAIDLANSYFGPTDIQFNPAVFASHKTITLTAGDLELSGLHGPIGLTGPTAGISISGGGKTDVLRVDANVQASLDDLAIIDGDGSAGGGITNYGTLTVLDCTISGNTTVGNGGGIENFGLLTMTNSTLAKNSSKLLAYSSAPGGDGGALYNSGTVSLTNVTVSGNTAYYGGGIDNVGTVTIGNTIVAGNKTTSAGGGGSDVVGLFSSLGHNLIGDTAGSGGWISTDLTGSALRPLNPLLSSLGNNGGPTETLFPQTASKAIGNGSVSLIPAGITTDQRGKPRTIDGKVDIGAVEV